MGGESSTDLLKVRGHYPVSLHGVCMGLASTAPLDQAHLSALCRLVMVQPAAVSEHFVPEFCARHDNQWLHGHQRLASFPYCQEALFMWQDVLTRCRKTWSPTTGGKPVQLLVFHAAVK
ncbi:MAG: DUF692 family protein [Nitrosomonadales bacterium]|nr:DUF692 family protein [Nitrosomonadales bacterium]